MLNLWLAGLRWRAGASWRTLARGGSEEVGEFFKAVVTRLTTEAIYQLAFVVAVAYPVARIVGLRFWELTAALAIPVLMWHGWGKAHAERYRERDRERLRLIGVAYDAVEMAYDSRVLNPSAQGNPYAILKRARDATDAVAKFLEKPPQPLAMEFDQELLKEWMDLLRDARRDCE